MIHWESDIVERVMLESLYGRSDLMVKELREKLEKYQNSPSSHPEIKNRIDILKRLIEKYYEKKQR